MEHPERVAGGLVTLRPGRPEDKRAIFEWLALSDVTPSMMGPPLFPDNPPPSWEEFRDDYKEHYFDGSEPEQGRIYVIEAGDRAVGAISYSPGGAGDAGFELDIWMRAEEECGKGYGPDALLSLCRHLESVFGPRELVIRPSARNRRAVAAYEKAGFSPVAPGEEEMYGPGEYTDAVTLVRRP
jgi:RimJ/RimL family protein N-acetyltransferase